MTKFTHRLLFSAWIGLLLWLLFQLFGQIQSIGEFVVRVGVGLLVYGLTLAIARYYGVYDNETLIIAALFPVTSLGMLMVVEQPWLKAGIGVGVPLLMTSMTYRHLIAGKPLGLSFPAYRRYQTMILLMAAYQSMVFFAALRMFSPVQATIGIALFHTLSAAVLAGLALLFWHLYYDVPSVRFTLWATIVGLAMLELSWVISLLPYGYLVNALILTWTWYLVVLLIRFHLHEKGIVWAKQTWFLSSNIAIFAIFFFFVFRWV